MVSQEASQHHVLFVQYAETDSALYNFFLELLDRERIKLSNLDYFYAVTPVMLKDIIKFLGKEK